MRTSFGLILAALTFSANTLAQSPTQAPPPQPDAQSTVIHANTQLVVVDVIVQDKAGNPIHGLKPENFHLNEGKTPQTIRHFEEHSASTPVVGPKIPPMPAGTFTDYTPVTPDGTLNILLLDALNTPTKDQTYVRQQLQAYVKKAPAGTRIAIFGLANRLILLQGFTADPQTLKDAVDHKLIARASSLLDDPTGSNQDTAQASELIDVAGASSPGAAAGLALQVANLQQFEAESAALETQLRVQYTLDAFNTLGHYLAAFPGRKNLIWFSGSFPINILPDPSLSNAFQTLNVNTAEYRETVSLLSKAQVAVYPIDARGLVAPPMYDVANSGRAYNPRNSSPGGNAFASANSKFNSSQATEHSTMDLLAQDTGGKASYNTNGIADAVARAVNSGSNYYTLTYTPIDRKEDGNYRSIHVDLSGAQPDLQLSYRRGYYADDASDKGRESALTTATPNGTATVAYQRAAMSRGAPAPQDLLFKVRVLPASNTPENAVVPGNSLDASVPASGPFRRYDVDYVALPSEFKLMQQPNGRRTGKVAFIVYVFDTDGRLLNASGQTIELNLTPDSYTKFIHNAIQAHIEVSVPTRVDTFLRVGVEDPDANKFGVVEIPVEALSHLPPAVYTAAPAASPAAPGNATSPANSSLPPSSNAAPSNQPSPSTAPSTQPTPAPTSPATPQG